ncbi:hypothetical protein B0T16DRAFT_461557 [Cercophora newfieldiana]|uniref:Uncharacterized protein n=1 Tax=Cercophora newfieldiana TaxID=92897 RepID=A0AA39XWP9_9PEZI|nr:hypothetical protein B0T16DRAFT_461557 [Cercophora newfieldiana]
MTFFGASDKDAINMIEQHWVPLGVYSAAQAKGAWANLRDEGRLAAWETSPPEEEVPNRRGPGAEAGRLGHIPELAKEMPFLGHVGGDFVFRCSEGRWLQYEGQVPRGNTKHLRRLREDLLPDIYTMAIIILSFDPRSGKLAVRPELAAVQTKRGFVNQRDLALLLDIWTIKFFNQDTDGDFTMSVRPAKMYPELSTKAAMNKCAEAASIVRSLQQANYYAGVEWNFSEPRHSSIGSKKSLRLLRHDHRAYQPQQLRGILSVHRALDFSIELFQLLN